MVVLRKEKEVQIHRLRLAEDTISFFDKWDDATGIGFLVEYSLEKIFNGRSSKELDNEGIDFISQAGTTYQVKTSTVGENTNYKQMIKKCRNAQKIILAYADTKQKKVYYTIQ
ncbi:MAG: hypothetical protein ACRCZ0_12295 [Cetobacterium sp.]